MSFLKPKVTEEHKAAARRANALVERSVVGGGVARAAGRTVARAARPVLSAAKRELMQNEASMYKRMIQARGTAKKQLQNGLNHIRREIRFGK